MWMPPSQSTTDKENAAATGKHTFGFHPLPVFLGRPDIAAGQALAGSNSAADHIVVWGQALDALPPGSRPGPDNLDAPQI
jgi:hypothetical protein